MTHLRARLPAAAVVISPLAALAEAKPHCLAGQVNENDWQKLNMALEGDHLSFASCANTIRNMERNTGKTIELLEEACLGPSGVVRLKELHEEGQAYDRP